MFRLLEAKFGTLSYEALNKKCKRSTVNSCLQTHVVFINILYIKAKYMHEENMGLEASVYGGIVFFKNI